MDNIYEYLKLDHKKVADLFKQFDKAKSFAAKTDYVKMICKELLIHAESEQHTFYKTLEIKLADKKDVLHGEKEHADIKNKITEINLMSLPPEAWQKKVKELQKIVEHHVDEEENKIFDEAKKVLSDDEAYILREQMHDLKEKILTQLDKHK